MGGGKSRVSDDDLITWISDDDLKIVRVLHEYLCLSSVGTDQLELNNIQEKVKVLFFDYFSDIYVNPNSEEYCKRIDLIYKMVTLIIEQIKKNKIPLESLNLDDKKKFLRMVLAKRAYWDVEKEYLNNVFRLKLQPKLKDLKF